MFATSIANIFSSLDKIIFGSSPVILLALLTVFATFFWRAWQQVTGHFIPTISMNLAIQRLHMRSANSETPKDGLVLTIKLKKEEDSRTPTLDALDVEIFRLGCDTRNTKNVIADCDDAVSDPSCQSLPVAWTNRSQDQRGILVAKHSVLAIRTTEEGRMLNLAPRECTQFGSYEAVEADGVYEVIVTLSGVRYRSLKRKPLFWISSIITAPLPPEANEPNIKPKS